MRHAPGVKTVMLMSERTEPAACTAASACASGVAAEATVRSAASQLLLDRLGPANAVTSGADALVPLPMTRARSGGGGGDNAGQDGTMARAVLGSKAHTADVARPAKEASVSAVMAQGRTRAHAHTL